MTPTSPLLKSFKDNAYLGCMDKQQYLPPRYLIIGERKCATSSLYRYLLAHPQVLPCKLKEPQFFSQKPQYIAEHILDYFALFPTQKYEGDLWFNWPELNKAGILYHEPVCVKRNPAINYITGEASANVFHEVAPELIYQYLPQVKLIVLFRNPVARAYSHHRMYVRFQEEGRDLGFRVNSFAEDMELEIAKINRGERSEYLSPGMYLNNLLKWEKVYGQQNILVLFTEQLLHPSSAQKVMNQVSRFIGINHYDFGNYLNKKFNKAPNSSIPKKIKKQLINFYATPNLALAKHLGRQLNWEDF